MSTTVSWASLRTPTPDASSGAPGTPVRCRKRRAAHRSRAVSTVGAVPSGRRAGRRLGRPRWVSASRTRLRNISSRLVKVTASRSDCPVDPNAPARKPRYQSPVGSLRPAERVVQLDLVEIAVRADPGVALVRPAGVTADQAAEEARLVVRGLLGRVGEPADAGHPVTDGQGGTARLGRADVPPAAVGEEPVLRAGHQPGAVGEGDPVGRLGGRPVGEDGGRHVAPVRAGAHRAEHGVAHRELGQRLGATVGHQHRGVPGQAVRAGVRAAAIGVDGPLERHPRGAGHPVDDRFRPDLVERHALEAGRVEGADGRAGQRQRQGWGRRRCPVRERVVVERGGRVGRG